MDTSKTQSIMSLLMQAWRERWTDVMWGIHIKTIIPQGESGDAYNLADCILRQALVGPYPNQLFMSFLVHTLSSGVISYGAVLSSIGRFQGFDKPHCVLHLLDLLKSFQSRIGCRGNEEECIAVCNAVVIGTHWLYTCILNSLTKFVELTQNPGINRKESISIIKKSYQALLYFNNSALIKSLLYIGKFENPDMCSQMVQKQKEIKVKLEKISFRVKIPTKFETALNLISSVDILPPLPFKQISETKKFQVTASSLNVMVGMDAILNPASDVNDFINRLLFIKKMQNFNLSQVYCEIIRTCLIGITDSSSSFEDDLKWFAFTFLKLPNLIAKFHSRQLETQIFDEVFALLLRYSPLLDLTDMKSNCDSMQYLTSEFCKVQILTEKQGYALVSLRQEKKSELSSPSCQINKQVQVVPESPSSQNNELITPKSNPQWGQANIPIILRAEHTLNTILKSLDSDYSKIQEALLGVLCHILPLRNFKVILAAAAATGKLKVFISKLIRYNEYNKCMPTESVKASQARALTFDVTFLLLTYISQSYGIDVIAGDSSRPDAFFVQWVSEYLSENEKFKSPELMLSRCDEAATGKLLAQFVSAEQEIKTHQVKWDEICLNAPAAAKEILTAWQHHEISTERVKMILDHIKSQICCIPVCISAWLCNYTNILIHEYRLKPVNMLQQFIAPVSIESVTSPSESPSNSGRQTPQISEKEQSSTFYFARCSLMNAIIKKMICDLHPPRQMKYNIPPIVPHGLTTKEPIHKIIHDLFAENHYHGWLDVKSIHYFETLFIVYEAKTICTTIVSCILSYEFFEDIDRAVDMAIAIFHSDIEQCALTLLKDVIPMYLESGEINEKKIAEPYGSALARLLVVTTCSALQSFLSANEKKIGSKRSYQEMDIDIKDLTEQSRPIKINITNFELLEDTPFALQADSDEQMHNAITNPIIKALAGLMQKFMKIGNDPDLTPRSYFPLRFLQQVVLCAKAHAWEILQFVPLGLVGLLLKKYPEDLSHEFVLAVSSMQSPRARKVAALHLCHLTIAKKYVTAEDKEYFGF